MVVLSLWELTRRDSVAEVILAVLMLLSMTAILLWAAVNVHRLAKRSVVMHQNPAYILYSNPKFLHTWGFLYVSYRATAYYWVFPTLFYIFIKGAFIGLSQPSPITQTIGLLCIETINLIFSSVFRPWMDKKTNTFNIAICAVHFVNAVFLLMFTSVFDQPVRPSPSFLHSHTLIPDLGNRQLRHGRRPGPLQRCLRPCPTSHGPRLRVLRHFQQEP